MLAATNRSVEMAERLLAANGDPNAARPNGETALMLAFKAGAIDVVRALVARGADVNAATERGFTPLIFAAAEGHAPVVGVLAETGAEHIQKSCYEPKMETFWFDAACQVNRMLLSHE